MASELYSSDALTELRRILLSPDALAEALRPVLTDLLREHSAQMSREMLEELAPGLRDAVREALREQLRELLPGVTGELASALEPSIANLVRQQLAAQTGTLTDVLQLKIQAALEASAGGPDAPQAEPPASPESASAKATAPDPKGAARKGCRRLLGIGLAFLITIVSTSWGWSRVDAVGELLSGHEARSGIVKAAGSEEPWDSLSTPASPISASPEVESAPDVSSVTLAHVVSPNIATPIPSATQTPAPTPVASFVQPGPTPQLEQELALSLRSAASTVRDVLLAAKEQVVGNQPQEAVADANPLSHAPASEEAIESADKVLYLTFDDGPNGLWTPQVLAILEQYDAHATFFVIGQEAAKRPELIQAIVDAGHIVAHHTYSHCRLEGIERDVFVNEIERTNRVLEGAFSPYLRAPGGVVDADVRMYAEELGLELVRWDIDPSDWKLPPAEEIAAMVIRRAGPGKIVVLHDGGGDRSQTVAALPVMLEALRDQGYVFEALGQN